MKIILATSALALLLNIAISLMRIAESLERAEKAPPTQVCKNVELL